MLVKHHTGCQLFILAIIGALCYTDLAFGDESDVAVSIDVTPNHDSPLNVSTVLSSLEENIRTNSVQISPENGTTGNRKLDSNITPRVDDDRLTVNNDFKRFLLFPFLPFLFPPGEDKTPLTSVDSLKPNGNDLKPEEAKPFILFDFAFNIREVPLANGSRVPLNDSEVINVKRISDMKAPLTEEDEIKDFQKMRRRRNISKRGSSGFLDDFPLLLGPQIDELFSKPNFFLPGSSERKATRKLSRRKRDMKRTRPDVRSDLQFFMDAIDRAFMQTKNDFEETDPIFDFLKGVQSPFDGDREIDLMNGFPNQGRPNVNWKIHRKVKRLNGKVQDKSLATKSRNGPVIIVDKVVKVGEFHVGDDKNKLSKDKRAGNELKRKYIDGLDHDEVRIPISWNKKEKEDTGSSNELSNPGSEVESNGSKKRKRKSDPEPNSDVKSREIRILPEINTSVVNVGTNTTIQLKKKDDENTSESDKFLKLIDSMRRRIKIDLTNNRTPSTDRLKRRSSYESQTPKIPFHDDLKRNITQVLNRFFELVKKLDDAKLMDKLEAGEREMEESFDWTETETLQNANGFGKGKKPKKESQFQEYLDAEKKERQAADLNYLFLTVTLAIILVFALVLLVCFFNLQVKGKIWTRLFRPRQIFLVEGKPPAQLNGNAFKMKSAQSI